MVSRQSFIFKSVTNFAIYFLALAEILKTYGYGGMFNFSQFLSLILVFFLWGYVFLNKLKITKLPKYLNIYFIWLCFVSLIYATKIQNLLPFGYLKTYFVFLAIFTFVDFQKFMKVYRFVVYISVFFVVFQEVFYFVFGTRISGILEFLPLDLGEKLEASFYYEHIKREGARSSAFFSEPAHFLQYSLPLFAVDLFSAKTKSEWFKVLFLLIGLLLPQSGTGLFGIASIIIVYVIFYIKKTSFHVIRVLALSFVTVVTLFCFITSDSGKKIMERQNELQSGIEISSGFLRVIRGYYVFEEYTPLEKVIGINNFDIQKEKILMCKAVDTFGEHDSFFNTIQRYLLNTGIIGCIMYVMLLLHLMKGNSFLGKSIIFCFFIMSFYAPLYLSFTMIMYVYIASNLKSTIKNKYEKNTIGFRNTSRSY